MLVSAAAIYGVGASSAFDYTKLELDGAQFTDPAAVEAALGGGRGENLFGLATAPLVAALESHADGRPAPGSRSTCRARSR